MSPQIHYKAVLDAAREHRRHGRYVIPTPTGSKFPPRNGWQNERWEEPDLPRQFSNGENLSILMGEPSGGFTDIDLDAALARVVAPKLLPPTGMVWGRKGSPKSHYEYVAKPIVETKKFRDPTVKAAAPNDDTGMLVELRSTGCQSIAPPSIHPNGERYRYDKDGEPAEVDGKELAEGRG